MDWIDEIDTMESMDSCDTSLTQKRSHDSADLNPILFRPLLKPPDMGVLTFNGPYAGVLGYQLLFLVDPLVQSGAILWEILSYL